MEEGILAMVSIPFKREGTFRPGNFQDGDTLEVYCFNSLQTGRHIQTIMILSTPLMMSQGFNSLQTGRHIQTLLGCFFGNLNQLKVSIPFKREGTFRPSRCTKCLKIRRLSFNSLQTGRHIQTQPPSSHSTNAESVSIPFKREGTFRPPFPCTYLRRIWFQFPSNGKAHSDHDLRGSNPDHNSFNSLQTGRHIQTETPAATAWKEILVSIPFKREGTFRP